jgi:MFS family permease
VDVYIVFAFFAATLAHKMGEWRTIVGATALWSIAMLALGPLPPFAPSLASVEAGAQAGGLGLSIATLVVLGITETFVFLPFIPIFHRRLRRTLGWPALETEDTVASVWTTTWACGQCLGPLIGGFLLDALPSTTAFACLAGISHASATEGLPDNLKDSAACQSAFPWVVAAWGMTGLFLAFLLVLVLLRERLRLIWRKRATKGLPVYSPDAALGELPLPGAAGHEDDYYYADGEQEPEEVEQRREGGDKGALASIGASMPRRPLLSMSSFYATEEYELDRSRRSVDQSRRSELDQSRRSELDRSRRSGLDRSRRSEDLDASLRAGGDFGHFVVEAGELDRSRRSENGGWEEGKA